MPSKRQRIRSELLARLTGLPRAIGGPITSRAENVAESEIPCAVVWVGGEVEGDQTTKDSVDLVVAVEITLIGKTDGGDEGVDVVDEMIEEVRSRMATAFEGGCFHYRQSPFDDEQDANEPFPSATLEYEYQYQSAPGQSL